MADPHRVHCQSCGRSRYDVGNISWSGLCLDCGITAQAENIEGITLKKGYPYLQWKRGMRRWALSLDLDEPPLSPQTGDAHA